MHGQRNVYWYAAFAATIFLSSFLLFQIQPMIGKYILPWFGGAIGVWTTCMLFFQVVLFAGYAYAHVLIKFFGPRFQTWVHSAVILAALALLPISPAESWKPIGTEEPIWRILGLLATTIGIPYFVLAANGPLVQAWFSRARPGVSPYGLYSLSNVGSLLGLISYPFVIEPWVTLSNQTGAWSWGFAIFAVLCLSCGLAISTVRTPPQDPSETGTFANDPRPTRVEWLWFVLPACASIILLATTNQVCIDVAAIPFLWVVPLILYLLSFVLTFAHSVWYPRRVFRIAFVAAVVSLCLILYAGAKAQLELQLFVYFTAMFIVCMVCHGELVLLKPHPSRLTLFYLLISAGGAAGGLFVGLLAPLVFRKYIELQIGIFASSLFVTLASNMRRDSSVWTKSSRQILVAALLGNLALAVCLTYLANKNVADQLVAVRNFYGVLRVRQYQRPTSEVRILTNGQILHGAQFMDPSKRMTATTYYGESSGVGKALRDRNPARRVGIVGLGAGTLAVYARPGDWFKFYDINPAVIRLAHEYFYFLNDCAVRPEIILGDARLSLDRESPQKFDVLVVDAFSSDAIPMHLLTVEAFRLFLKHLAEPGILAIHISNRHFNLQPVVQAAADHFGLFASIVHSGDDEEFEQNGATWILLARSSEALADLELSPSQLPQPPNDAVTGPLWTDNFSNLFRLLK